MKELNSGLASLLEVVKEFVRALGQKRTYSVRKNWYCFFGILWGLPIPFVTVAVDLYSKGLKLTLPCIIQIITEHPFHFFFLLHPLFFGIVFGAMGTVRHNKEQKIEESEKNLMNKNIELERANKKLSELDRLKSDFLSVVSHELRTPLTTISGYITFLRSEKAGTLNENQKDYLKISEGEADLLNRLIQELLDLSKIEAGEFKVNLAKVDMQEVIDKALAPLKFSADNQGIFLERKLPDSLPLVRADRERILQVITNLVENAIKFNQPGGKVLVSAESSEQDKKVIFSVQDTGIGIPEDKLGKIFDKFYQVDSSGKRKYGGCGLGLAISKSIITLHKGRLWAESEIGKGSKFFFELLKDNGRG